MTIETPKLDENDGSPPIHEYFRSRIQSIEERTADVEFACECGFEYAWRIAQRFGRKVYPDRLPDLSKLHVLELGPGLNFAAVAVCAASGAETIAVVDRYLVDWHDNYHTPFYSTFRGHVEQRFPDGQWDVVDSFVNSGAHQAAGFEFCRSDFGEGISRFQAGRFNAVVSNAVLEHIGDVECFVEELRRVTASGGVGIHQVDFRDHSNNDRPLEFLKTPDEEYARTFRESLGGGGNRIRPIELMSLFESHGFEVEQFEENTFADDAYVNEVRSSLLPRFASLPVEQLRIVGGRIYVRTQGQS